MNAHSAFDSERLRDAYPPGIERSWWHVARDRVIHRTLSRHIHRASQVLEVGCGTGIVTNALRARGWNVTGVDIADPLDAVRQDGHLILGTDARMLPNELRGSIDVLALFDVIEHVNDAPAFLRELLAAFPMARQVVLTVPARKELWTSFDDHYGHFHRYDPALLQEELRGAGLEVEHMAYFFHALHPIIALNNLVRGRKRAIRFHAPRSALSIAFNSALGSLFAVESTVLPGAIPGSSLIAVAHVRSAGTQ